MTSYSAKNLSRLILCIIKRKFNFCHEFALKQVKAYFIHCFTTACRQWSSNHQALDLESTTLPLSHCARQGTKTTCWIRYARNVIYNYLYIDYFAFTCTSIQSRDNDWLLWKCHSFISLYFQQRIIWVCTKLFLCRRSCLLRHIYVYMRVFLLCVHLYLSSANIWTWSCCCYPRWIKGC